MEFWGCFISSMTAILGVSMMLLWHSMACADGIAQEERTFVFITPKTAEIPSLEGIKAYVFKKKENVHTDHFCLVKEKFKDKQYGVVWLHWQEKNLLIRWESESISDPLEEMRALGISKFLNLTTDVVNSEEEIGTSSYFVTRSWVEKIQGQCKKKGIKRVLPVFEKLRSDA